VTAAPITAARPGAIRRLLAAAVHGPSYEPDAEDLADVRVAGLAIPVRATVALFVATAAIVLDETRRLVAPAVDAALGSGDPTTNLAVERAILLGALPFVVLVAGFRDTPARYGFTFGAWRWGAGLLLAGLAVMTPIIAWLSTFPEFSAYYRAAAAPLATVLLRNVLELGPAEFLLRGFLMFALLRRIGPLAIIVVQVPFVLTHVGKPEIELWSTFLGGSVFAWLDWRTGSVLWSALGHVYILTLMVVLAGGLPA
jgi:membrane protease YdiL (CAAX protease family)